MSEFGVREFDVKTQTTSFHGSHVAMGMSISLVAYYYYQYSQTVYYYTVYECTIIILYTAVFCYKLSLHFYIAVFQIGGNVCFEANLVKPLQGWFLHSSLYFDKVMFICGNLIIKHTSQAYRVSKMIDCFLITGKNNILVIIEAGIHPSSKLFIQSDLWSQGKKLMYESAV